MRIDQAGIEPQRSRPVRGVQAAGYEGRMAAEPGPEADGADPRNDRVQISDAGRALAARQADTHAALTPERAGEIRERVLSGAYDSAEVVAEVARRILERGDA